MFLDYVFFDIETNNNNQTITIHHNKLYDNDSARSAAFIYVMVSLLHHRPQNHNNARLKILKPPRLSTGRVRRGP